MAGLIGHLVDDAMAGIDRDNPVLKDVLPKDYARPTHQRARLTLRISQRIFLMGSV